MAFAEGTKTERSKQPYKYGDKLLDDTHGLNVYDFEARYSDPALANRFMMVDPLAEKYYSISPYVYCNNNPIKFIDPTGMWYIYNWNTGSYEYQKKNGERREAEKVVLDAKTLQGLGYNTTFSGSLWGIGFSQDITRQNGKSSYGTNWNIITVTLGFGISPITGQYSLSNTSSPYYLHKFNKK